MHNILISSWLGTLETYWMFMLPLLRTLVIARYENKGTLYKLIIAFSFNSAPFVISRVHKFSILKTAFQKLVSCISVDYEKNVIFP